MIDGWVRRFLRWGVVFLLIGLASGFGPVGHYLLHGDERQCSWAPVHAHLTLLGWLGMTVFGLTYRALGEAVRSEKLVRWHFLLCAVGLVGVLVHGVAGAVVVGAFGAGWPELAAERYWYGVDGLFLAVYGAGCLCFWAAVRGALSRRAPA